MKIGVDINQLKGTHAYSNAQKHMQMRQMGVELIPLRIPFGDYILIDDKVEKVISERGGPENVHKKDLLKVIRLSVDTKKNLVEVCQNVCQQHLRFKKELLKPLQESDSRLVLLIEEAEIESIGDVYFWDNPRLEFNQKAVTGNQLYKSLCTIQSEYNVDIQFCSRADTGKRIIEIFGGGEIGKE